MKLKKNSFNPFNAMHRAQKCCDTLFSKMQNGIRDEKTEEIIVFYFIFNCPR